LQLWQQRLRHTLLVDSTTVAVAANWFLQAVLRAGAIA
jgi:hypothetical protein